MKRRALLIGNSNGLAGVKLDISNYVKFLTSDYGGQWYQDPEIVIRMNPTRKLLLETIQSIKNENPDFAFVVFSGHGAYQKTTILEINKDEEIILESELAGIAKRQISIFDCCRNVILTQLSDSRKSFAANAFIGDPSSIRPKYEARIMQAIEQQNFLYACSINESALDTEEGGLYTKNLLVSTIPLRNSQFKLVGETHEEAASKTSNAAWTTKLHRQNPTATLPRCLSSQQLIFSINPNYNTLYS